jgi:hypothetical protein
MKQTRTMQELLDRKLDMRRGKTNCFTRHVNRPNNRIAKVLLVCHNAMTEVKMPEPCDLSEGLW